MSAQTASWFHCSVKALSRSSGRSVVAAAAYRFGVRLEDRETQLHHDYTRRSGVEATFIVTPENAPAWSQDLQALWNAAQESDRRKNSCMARECELALPNEVSAETREHIARAFADHLVERYGVGVAVAVHAPSWKGDERNYHAHILFTTRSFDPDGLGAKTRVLDAKATGAQEVKHLREFVCDIINAALEEAGSTERVDHRSFKDRGIDKEGTQHLGPEAAGMESKGKDSRIGDHNRQVMEDNAQRDALHEEKAALDIQIEQAQQAEAALSFEERKRRGQSVFSMKEEESEIDTPPPEKAKGRWDAMKQRLQSAFDFPLTRAFADDLTETGLIREYDEGPGWMEQSATFARHFIYNAVTRVREKTMGFWTTLVRGGCREAFLEPEQDPDQEPKMER